MPRRAYVGLSSPIFYDYGNPAGVTVPNQYSSPNPILDGPTGLMLFYDELLFLTRSVCPENMRELPFVKFADEIGVLKGLAIDSQIDSVAIFGQDRIDYMRAGFSDYEQQLFNKGVHWWGPGARIDNHTHVLPIKEPTFPLQAIGNSMDPHKVVVDFAIANHLGAGYEFVGNSFTDRLLWGPEAAEASAHQLAQCVLEIRSIPNYQSVDGPYHPCLQELRDNSNLRHFRDWISNKSGNVTSTELADVAREVQQTVNATRDTLARYYFDQKNEVKSLSKTIFGWGLDLSIPYLGKVFKVWDAAREHEKKEATRWQGFVLQARET